MLSLSECSGLSLGRCTASTCLADGRTRIASRRRATRPSNRPTNVNPFSENYNELINHYYYYYYYCKGNFKLMYNVPFFLQNKKIIIVIKKSC